MSSERSKNKGRVALGKGLEALIPGAKTTASSPPPRDYFQCPVARIQPDPNQPRQNFNKAALDELLASIKEQGIIQPLIVKTIAGDKYELIAGERRWRAAQLAGLKEVPVLIKDVTAAQAFEMALVENIQREDLNAIEEAEAIRRLLEEHRYTQAQIATRIGRDRSTVANSLRLLNLPLDGKQMVLDRKLTEGHARAVLQAGTDDHMLSLAKMIIAKGWSVRETERQARLISQGPAKATAAAVKAVQPPSPPVAALTEKLHRALGARVGIHDTKGKGRREIHYANYEELDTVIDKILR